MRKDFNEAFAGFLAELMGMEGAFIRGTNKNYRNMVDERDNILNTEYETLEQYSKAFSRIAELNEGISEIEKTSFFLAGIRERQLMREAVLSDKFLEMLVDKEY